MVRLDTPAMETLITGELLEATGGVNKRNIKYVRHLLSGDSSAVTSLMNSIKNGSEAELTLHKVANKIAKEFGIDLGYKTEIAFQAKKMNEEISHLEAEIKTKKTNLAKKNSAIAKLKKLKGVLWVIPAAMTLMSDDESDDVEGMLASVGGFDGFGGYDEDGKKITKPDTAGKALTPEEIEKFKSGKLRPTLREILDRQQSVLQDRAKTVSSDTSKMKTKTMSKAKQKARIAAAKKLGKKALTKVALPLAAGAAVYSLGNIWLGDDSSKKTTGRKALDTTDELTMGGSGLFEEMFESGMKQTKGEDIKAAMRMAKEAGFDPKYFEDRKVVAAKPGVEVEMPGWLEEMFKKAKRKKNEE